MPGNGTMRAVTELGSDPIFARQERLELEAIGRRFEGRLGLCSMRLDDSGAILEVGGDETFPAASVIMIAVALEVFCQVAENTLALTDRVPLRSDDKVIGSGVLAQLN